MGMPFIVFEGLDGSGKSTLITHLTNELKRQKITFVSSREPGGTPLGQAVRQLLLTAGENHPIERAEMLLYMADRAQHVERVIKPALGRGEWVISDRYTASTMAFQCGGRGMVEDKAKQLNEFATDGLKPDLWVLIDLSVEQSEARRLKRVAKTGEALDRFETEEKAFHQRVRNHYLEQARAGGKNWLILDGSAKPEALCEKLMHELRERKWLAN